MDMKRNIIIWLNYIGISNNMIKKILNYPGDIEEILIMDLEVLRSKLNISKVASEKIINKRKNIDKDLIEIKEFNVITFLDEEYPESLKYIEDNPLVLYYKGNIDLLKADSIGIVGTRKATTYGRYVCEKITSELVNNNLVVVSGLASGIDTIAHRKALEVNGKTIAVLGCGITICYPKRNEKLYEDIESKGLILSEFPPTTAPLAYNFPQRNRIISGLSKAIVVVEAKEKSGSLITARYAAEQGRDVFAVPGNVNSLYSRGTNRLIRDGAIPLLEINDILDFMPDLKIKMEKSSLDLNLYLSDLEKEILNLIEKGPISSDLLSRLLNINIKDLNGILTVLELKGVIKEINSQFIIN